MSFRSAFFPLLLLPLLLSGCLSSLLGSKDKRSDKYSVPKPGAGWESIDPAGSDSAYRNTRDQAILNISSVCGSDRFRSLEDLTQDILKQLPHQTVTGTPVSRLTDGHPTMITEAEGQVDGSPLSVRVAVIRTPGCLYDFILAGSRLDTTSLAAFQSTLDGFRER